ncbi:hypothetical protein [Paenibacillus sp. FSL M7-0896]|uniref:hypothetical protein n=1 Tax=Paenibacillus sp. FSL M7-0896 TaxID=2921610 RepID=UPI0030DCE85D
MGGGEWGKCNRKTKFGAAWARGPNVIEKPTIFSAAWARGPNVIEKPTIFGAAWARGPNVIEKPTTFGAAWARGPNVIEKPTTFKSTSPCQTLSTASHGYNSSLYPYNLVSAPGSGE